MNNTPAPAMQKLKPCPFCGGPVDLENTIDSRSWWGVVCRNTVNRGGTCAVQIRPSASKETAIERWNMRAPVADDLVASLRRMASVAPASECEVLHAAANALASAPVAGEATYYAVMHGRALFGVFDTEAGAKDCVAKALHPRVMSVRPLYAAPQASEAVRDVTPWQDAERLSELPQVDEALEAFANDPTADNAVGLVRTVLDAALSAQPGARKKEQSDA